MDHHFLSFFEPAKQAEAYSLGWSEALRAQPQDLFNNNVSARETGGSATIPDAAARFAGSIFISNLLGFRSQSLAPPQALCSRLLRRLDRLFVQSRLPSDFGVRVAIHNQSRDTLAMKNGVAKKCLR